MQHEIIKQCKYDMNKNLLRGDEHKCQKCLRARFHRWEWALSGVLPDIHWHKIATQATNSRGHVTSRTNEHKQGSCNQTNKCTIQHTANRERPAWGAGGTRRQWRATSAQSPSARVPAAAGYRAVKRLIDVAADDVEQAE